MHSHQALTALAIVVLAALACGMAMTRFKQPAVVGYILAGVILGPSVLGLVRNRESVQFLAELGVLMLLFLVGMELSIKSFKAVWRLATWTTLAQIGGSLGIMLRSEEHTSELQSLMRISYAVLCLKNKKKHN